MNKAIRCFWLAPLVFLPLAAEPPSAVLLRNARVHPVSGPVIPRGSVLLRDGLIEAVGDNIAAPPGVWVIEAQGLNIYPGLIDALSTWGLQETPSPPANAGARLQAPTQQPAAPQPVPRGPEERPLNFSYQRAADQLQPSDRRIEQARNTGFTSAVSFPPRGIFAGQGVVWNLSGDKPGRMVVQSPAGLYLTLTSGGFGSGFPSSLMGTIAYIRQVFLDAGHYKMAVQEYAKNPRGLTRPPYDRTLEGVLESSRILLPANTVAEAARMIRFASELKRPCILYGLQQAYAAVGSLKQAGAPVLVNLHWPEKAPDADPGAEETYRTLELRDKAPSSPAALHNQGVPFAFYSGGIENPRDIPKAVKKAIDAGLPAVAALRALTLAAAEIHGVADRLGSLEKGKIANLVVTDGELFQERTKVKFVFIDGAKYEPLPEAAASKEEAK